MPYSLTDMALYFFMYSFCGWLMETALCSFQEKRFVNRGFLNGPFCPIYGCGIVLILIFLLPVRDGIDKLWVAVPVIFAAGGVSGIGGGILHLLADGKAVPRPVVGLLPFPLQFERPDLPADLPGLGWAGDGLRLPHPALVRGAGGVAVRLEPTASGDFGRRDDGGAGGGTARFPSALPGLSATSWSNWTSCRR